MSKRPNDLARERKQLDAMAAGEARIHERLLTLRADLDLIARGIDRLTMPPRRPRMMAGVGDLRALANLLEFPRRTKP